jgi:hypothetical protein
MDGKRILSADRMKTPIDHPNGLEEGWQRSCPHYLRAAVGAGSPAVSRAYSARLSSARAGSHEGMLRR